MVDDTRARVELGTTRSQVPAVRAKCATCQPQASPNIKPTYVSFVSLQMTT